MARIPIVISARSLGTSTAITELSGDRSGNATDFITPTWCRAMTKVRTSISQLTPTAAQTVFSTLRVTSSDLNVGNYEVLCEPLGSVLGATAFQVNGNGQNAATYDWNMGATQRLKGGEHFQFYGQAQLANTVAPYQAAMVWCDSDGHDTSRGGQWYSIATSINQNSNNPGETGTAAGTQNASVFTISGQGAITIRALYGFIALTTIVASDVTVGYFQIDAPEFQYHPLYWLIEPVNGFLGATGQVQELISQCEGIAVNAVTPTSVTPTFVLTTPPANDGDWEVAMMYQ